MSAAETEEFLIEHAYGHGFTLLCSMVHGGGSGEGASGLFVCARLPAFFGFGRLDQLFILDRH